MRGGFQKKKSPSNRYLFRKNVSEIFLNSVHYGNSLTIINKLIRVKKKYLKNERLIK